LGRFELRLDGEDPTPLASARAESVLALLLLEGGGPLPRASVASAIWPDSTDAQARTNLRHVLHDLRHGLPSIDRYLEVGPHELRLRPDVPLRTDVTLLEDLLSDRGPATDDRDVARLHALREAVALGAGELLEDHDDEWLREHRERLRRGLHDALAELVTLCERSGAVDEAVRHAERLRRADPLREDAYRLLMRLHAARGDRARAARVYHQCASTLEHELGVGPSPDTRAAYDALLPVPTSAGEVPASSTADAGPLVGRRRERGRLEALWRVVEAGGSRFVLISGDPGIGKSRLAEEVGTWCRRRGARVAHARCHPAEGPLAYGVVTTWLRADAVWPSVLRMGPSHVSELARLVPELLAERPDALPPVLLAEAEQRRRLFEAVAAAVVSPARPTLLVVDDVHAVDRESARLLHYLVREPPGPGLLVLATGRHEEMDGGDAARDLLSTLHARGAVDEIELGPLDAHESVALARRLAGPTLTTDRARRLVDETEGNPLFVVEAVRAGWTATAGTTARVQSAVELRLARLDPRTRDLAALAATIGREFDLGVLRAAAEVDEDTLVRGLDELWRRRLVRERAGGIGHGGSYEFSHGKIRQVVVDTTGPAQRRRLHARIAAALVAARAEGTDRVSARVAVHLEGAGEMGRAVGWYRRAARAARALHAHHEAVRLLERGLALLADQAATTSRARRELALRTDLLAPLVTVAAYESPRMRANQERAVELAHGLGTDPSPPLVRSLALSALTRSDFAAATGFGHRLARLAHRAGDPVLEVEAAYVLGVSAFWQADLVPARDHFRHALACYDPAQATIHQLHYAQDPKVVCQGRLANTLWFLGEPDEARRAASEALDWARRLDHPFSRTIALTFAALLALDMGDEQALREHTAGLLAVGDRTVSRHVTEAFRGHLAVLDGHAGEGLARVRAAVVATGPVGTAPGQHAFLLRVLLASCLAAGDVEGAREAADRLLAMGGPGRLWTPVARSVRDGLAGGTAAERRPAHAPASHPPVTQEEP
ncbi:MAG TPA: AAA family ATPase, partial [Actinomycetospora sp.]|nr:AAA family ATPase [Actinomycetospora sp.]